MTLSIIGPAMHASAFKNFVCASTLKVQFARSEVLICVVILYNRHHFSGLNAIDIVRCKLII